MARFLATSCRVARSSMKYCTASAHEVQCERQEEKLFEIQLSFPSSAAQRAAVSYLSLLASQQ
ncbi:MAG: hypothetical protein IKW66_02120, partial [Clostridia bacterium]|nr:hypothetical protein [Clostridia bacterium]